jgi:hypothetical protein
MGGQSQSQPETVVVEEEVTPVPTQSSCSETSHPPNTIPSTVGVLHFKGIINTNGGGFASIRAKLPPNGLLLSTKTNTLLQGIKVRYRGDGKTYKVLLGTGERGGPFSKTPNWQHDLPTTKTTEEEEDKEKWEEVFLPFTAFQASFGGGPKRQPTDEGRKQYVFDPTTIQEIGFMLSLKLSNGTPNPETTFGTGVFPFSLHVQSITPY